MRCHLLETVQSRRGKRQSIQKQKGAVQIRQREIEPNNEGISKNNPRLETIITKEVNPNDNHPNAQDIIGSVAPLLGEDEQRQKKSNKDSEGIEHDAKMSVQTNDTYLAPYPYLSSYGFHQQMAHYEFLRIFSIFLPFANSSTNLSKYLTFWVNGFSISSTRYPHISPVMRWAFGFRSAV